MGMSYKVDKALGVVFEKWSGTITAKELGPYWRGLVADPEVLACDKVLVDVRDVVPGFSGEEVRKLVVAILEAPLKERSFKIAVLVSKPVQYGVARQFQVYSSLLSESEVFRDEAEALAWLTRPAREG